MARNVDIYENTPENAKRIGWDRVPVMGDPSKSFVFHAVRCGVFFFIDQAERDIVETAADDSDIRIGLI